MIYQVKLCFVVTKKGALEEYWIRATGEEARRRGVQLEEDSWTGLELSAGGTEWSFGTPLLVGTLMHVIFSLVSRHVLGSFIDLFVVLLAGNLNGEGCIYFFFCLFILIYQEVIPQG
jgi:hypothetical protein